MDKPQKDRRLGRRGLLVSLLRACVLLLTVVPGIKVIAAYLHFRHSKGKDGDRSGLNVAMVWQIDPYKCIKCGNCASYCVLSPSAVKCVHAWARCGFCEICSGYHSQVMSTPDTAAENQLCPTGAIVRRFVEDQRFEYYIVEGKCIGCGKCVEGCEAFGNGSLFLQIRHNLCVNCNQCRIAEACPAGAISRVPVDSPYIIKKVESAS